MNHNRVLWDGPILVEQWPGKDMKGLDQITEGWSKVHGSRETLGREETGTGGVWTGPVHRLIYEQQRSPKVSLTLESHH